MSWAGSVGVSFAVLVTGCGAPQAAQPPPVHAPVAIAPGSVGTAIEAVQMHLEWVSTEASPSCFFFSGPALPQNEVRQPFPREARWQREGEHVSVEFGEARFNGRDGLLTRQTSHDFGQKWVVTETLTLDAGAPPSGGSYHYEECPEAEGTGCDSQCVIEGRFVLRSP